MKGSRPDPTARQDAELPESVTAPPAASSRFQPQVHCEYNSVQGEHRTFSESKLHSSTSTDELAI